mmetsp:Transcript_18110/g.32385  ORF Transcript_18110/g.32385 Transcript_18110/m.32385 type:complete len:186 (+) Transcript_18110:351-908(+)
MENDFTRQKLVVPESNKDILVASCSFHCFHFKIQDAPLLYPYTEWTLKPFPGSLVNTVCSDEELSAFVKHVNEAFKDTVSDLNRFVRATNYIRVAAALSIIAAILLCSTLVHWFVGVLIACCCVGAYFGLNRVIAYSTIKRKADSFYKHLAEWVKLNRTAMLEKGIKARPGIRGTFLIFEGPGLG